MKTLLRYCLLTFIMMGVSLQADAKVKVLDIEFSSAGDLTQQLKATGYLKSGTVTYDGNQTLTLDNVDIGDYINTSVINSLSPLTIKLVGANKILNWVSTTGLMDIYVWGNLTITGTGSLLMNSGSKGYSIQMMGEGSKMTITGGCSLTIANDVCNGLNFCADNQSLTINHSTLKVTTKGKRPVCVDSKSFNFAFNLVQAKFSEPDGARWVTVEQGAKDEKYTVQGVDNYGIAFTSSYVTIIPDDDIPVETVKIDPKQNLLLGVGDTYQLYAMYTPSDATGAIIWQSRNESVVTVDKTGLVKAVGTGSTYIDLWGNSIGGNVRDVVYVTVTLMPTSITVDPTSVTLTELGQTFKPTVTVLPNDATDRSYKVSYDESILTYSAITGAFTAVGYGTTQIRYTTVNKKEAICTVTVKEPEPEIPQGVFFDYTPNNVQMYFNVTNSEARECEVYGYFDDGVWLYITAIDEATEEEVTIPSEVKGLKVTGISDYAFYHCYQMPKVTVPAGVRYIGYAAFEECPELHHVYMLMATPPTASNQAFSSLPGDATLHVQKGTKSLWQSPWTGWFNTIIDDVPTHIGGVQADDGSPSVYYNLSGQQLRDTRRGIVIEKNGKTPRKVIVK